VKLANVGQPHFKKKTLVLGGAALQRCDRVAFRKSALAAEVAMAAPHRGNTGFSTYFITSATFQKHSLFQSDRMADLFLEVLLHYRTQQKYLLHEFVIMPDHFHLLLTPTLTLERALQLIKGGFSSRAKKELGFGDEIWEKSFYDRRVRDWQEYCAFRQYIHQNPVKKGLVDRPEEYLYSSARPRVVLDSVPEQLRLAKSTA
jgi:putative transposase